MQRPYTPTETAALDNDDIDTQITCPDTEGGTKSSPQPITLTLKRRSQKPRVT
jgi:hypothetical protein